MKIGIGIDTGGTYTDAVIYDFAQAKILSSAKALTTKNDLSTGILCALDGLPSDLVQQATVLALSTTLATNACVENKGGHARLIFFGGNSKVIDSYGSAYGLPALEEIYLPVFHEVENEDLEDNYHPTLSVPEWDKFTADVEAGFFANLDGIGIVELNSMWHGASAEKTAKEIIAKNMDIPVVCGYELFSELNCLQRGASTLLNARLFPVIKGFLAGIQQSMEQRGIDVPKFIVRSDGSLMTEQFSHERPVETLISGPAASVMGAVGLTNEKNAVIVDIGGTTTDIAIVKNGDPVRTEKGINIGKWKTFVKGLYVRTIGLGGDSCIHYKDNKLVLEEYRVMPLSLAAQKYPQMKDSLKALSRISMHKHFLHEHYLQVKSIADNPNYTDDEKLICAALDNGPLSLRALAAAVDRDIYALRLNRLIKDEVVQICGLTPTDIMHLRGDFAAYDKEAALYGAAFVASNLGLTVDELCAAAYDEFERKLYLNIVSVMLENEQTRYIKDGISEDMIRYIKECYDMAKEEYRPAIMEMGFKTDFSLIGVGAPTHIFLDDVAKLLGTKAIIPPFSGVANALGAILGNFYAEYTVELMPIYDENGIAGYSVYGKGATYRFEELEDAEACAEQEAQKAAKEEALLHGALGEVRVSSQVIREITTGRGGLKIHLSSKAIATAVSSIGI